MILEVRMAAERAQARRLSLLGLVEIVPPDYWSRREPGEDWTARQHLEHLATADALLRDALRSAESGDLLVTPYDDRRAALMAEVAGHEERELLARMRHEREETLRALERLQASTLEVVVALPGVVDAFGQPRGWTVRQFLSSWSEHETGHELTIRRAITTPPDAGSLAAAARRRRG